MPKKFKVIFEYENSRKFIEFSHKDITDEADAEVRFWERMNDAGISEVDILNIEEV